MASDLIPPVPDDPSFGFVLKNWLFKMRRNVNQFAIDISTLVTEIAQAISPTNPLTSGNIATYVNTQTISNNYVADGTLTGTKLASATITGSNIANTTITASNIVNGTITGTQIANTTITASNIVNGTITGTQIANTTISDSNIVNATITGGKIASATITDGNIASLNADKITAGAIRGINVNAASHTTKGSYLTAALSGGETTVNVKDTIDFPTSGTVAVFDTLNDFSEFTYTGKTSTSFTGCSFVVGHSNGASVVPMTKCITIDNLVNELRIYGNRGDGTVENIARIGNTDTSSYVGVFGSASSGATISGVIGSTDSAIGVVGGAGSGDGVRGEANTGRGGYFSSLTGIPLHLYGNLTKGSMYMLPIIGRPSNRTAGLIAMILTTGGTTDNRTATPRLMYADDTDWRKVSDDTIWTG